MKYIKALNDQIVLKPIEEGEQKRGNIIIPDLGHERPIMGEVVDVSEGTYNFNTDKFVVPHKIKVGDIVLIPKMGATMMPIDGQDYYITQSSQLLAKLVNGED